MAGSPSEYERMALASMEKAAEDVSDTTYHLKRAQIFATLAQAASLAGDGEGATVHVMPDDRGPSKAKKAEGDQPGPTALGPAAS